MWGLVLPRDESRDIVTTMIPMLRKHGVMLREIHREAMRQDSRNVKDYRVFAAMVFGAMVEATHAKMFPKLIADPATVRGGWRGTYSDPVATLRRRGEG